MADSIIGTSIKQLQEAAQSQLNDSTDLIVEDATPTTRRTKLSTLANWIKTKLGIGTASSLQTTSKEIVGAINELSSSSVTQKIAPFVKNSNFTVHDTSIFYNQLTNMIFFSIKGDFINGARTLGTINEPYRPSEKIILTASNGGATIDTNGLVVLDKNDTPTGTVSVMGFWRVAKPESR